MHGCLQTKIQKKKNSTANEYEILLNNNEIMQFILFYFFVFVAVKVGGFFLCITLNS